MSRLSLSRRFTSGELALVGLGLAVLAFLAFFPHMRHGGFYMDDWSNAAGALQPPGSPNAGAAIEYFADLTIYRPVLVIYVPLTYFVFGMTMELHLAWAAILAVFVATMLYGVLRTLGVPWIHAWLVSSLTLLYPWFDSTRFWATASQISLSVGLTLAGLWLALVGLSRQSWRWHAAAVALYVTSILAYEITLPLIAAAGVIYTLRAGWRAARFRWLLDFCVAVAGAIWIAAHTKRSTSTLSDSLEHLEQIVTEGGKLLGRTLLPLGDERTTLALCALFAIFAVGLGARLAFPERFPDRSGWGLRGWLLLTAGGVGVAALGWTMFIPADPYYTPTVYGMTNRVNGLAGIGLVMTVYGALGILGTLIGQLRPRATVLALAITVSLGILLGAGFVDVLRRHTAIWNAAFAGERTAIDRLKAEFPRLPSWNTLLVGGYPANQTLGVPILGSTWDLDGMVKMEWDDRTLGAYPILPGFEPRCRAEGVQIEALETTVAYGTAILVDLGDGQRSKPRDRAACRHVIDGYGPGPEYLTFGY